MPQLLAGPNPKKRKMNEALGEAVQSGNDLMKENQALHQQVHQLSQAVAQI